MESKIKFNVNILEERYMEEIINTREKKKQDIYNKINEINSKVNALEAKYLEIGKIPKNSIYFDQETLSCLKNLKIGIRTYMYDYNGFEDAKTIKCKEILFYIIKSEKNIEKLKDVLLKEKIVNEEVYDFVEFFYEIKKDIEESIKEGIL